MKNRLVSLDSGLVVMVQSAPSQKAARYIPAKGSPDEVRRGKIVKTKTHRAVGKLARALNRDGAKVSAAEFVRSAINKARVDPID